MIGSSVWDVNLNVHVYVFCVWIKASESNIKFCGNVIMGFQKKKFYICDYYITTKKTEGMLPFT